MEPLYTITYTAKPLSGGRYAIYKNWIPLVKNKAGVGYSHPTHKRRQRIMTTKNPKQALYALGRQKGMLPSPYGGWFFSLLLFIKEYV